MAKMNRGRNKSISGVGRNSRIPHRLNIGDRVTVIGQAISGEVIRFDGSKIVILDDEPGQDLEEGDEATLTFRSDQLEVYSSSRTN